MKVQCYLSASLAVFGWSIAGSSLYGGWPPAVDLLEHLTNGGRRGGLEKVFEKAFSDVWKEADTSGFENLKFFGEQNGKLARWKRFDGKQCNVEDIFDPSNVEDISDPSNVEDISDPSNVEDISDLKNNGFFSCMVNGICVSNDKSFREITEDLLKARKIDEKKVGKIVKICRVLLSEGFAERLLTKSFVEAFFENGDGNERDGEGSVSCAEVWFNRVYGDLNVLSLVLSYESLSCKSPLFHLRLSVPYNIEKDRFVFEDEIDINEFSTVGCYVSSDVFSGNLVISSNDLVAVLNELREEPRKKYFHVKGRPMLCERKQQGRGKNEEEEKTDNKDGLNRLGGVPMQTTRLSTKSIPHSDNVITKTKGARTSTENSNQPITHSNAKSTAKRCDKETQTEEEVWEFSNVFFGAETKQVGCEKLRHFSPEKQRIVKKVDMGLLKKDLKKSEKVFGELKCERVFSYSPALITKENIVLQAPLMSEPSHGLRKEENKKVEKTEEEHVQGDRNKYE